MLVYSQHPSEGVSNTVQKDVGIDGTKEDKIQKNAFDKKNLRGLVYLIRGLEDIFLAFYSEGYMNKNHFVMRLYPWVL